MKAHARLRSVLATLALATSSASADPLVIYQTSGELTDTGVIAGTTRGLSVNLPGATWSCGTIWNWSRPTYAWSYTDLGNAINCGEEYAGAVLPLASTGDYVRPSLIRIDVTFFSSQGASCVGFWNTEPYEWYEDEDGTHNFNVGGTIACGIVYTTSTRTLQVAENGALVGSAVSVFADNANGLHSLSLLADTSTGELLAVWWDGARVQGLSSMAFTEAATTYVGCAARQGGRITFGDFKVSEGELPDPTPSVTVGSLHIRAFTGREITFPVTAQIVETGAPNPVTASSETASGFTFADGTFSWTPTAAGTYAIAFTSTLGTQSDTKTVTLHVFALPEPLTYVKPIYKTDRELITGGVKYAGETWNDPETCTDYGLTANIPGGRWIWSTGFDWAPPNTDAGNKLFGLGNERGVVLLPLTNTVSFTRPRRMRYFARFRPSGWVQFGFWDRPRDIPGGENALGSTGGFSGLELVFLGETINLYSAGSKVATVPFSADVTLSDHTVDFVVNRNRGTLERLLIDGWPVTGFAADAISFTDAATAYVGLGTGGNSNYGNARMSFSDFELDDLVSTAVVVLLR